MAVLSPHQARAVERGNGHSGEEQEAHNRGDVVLATQGRPECATDQDQPQHEADEQGNLPEPAEIHIFPTLVTEPEIVREPELLHDCKPLPGERANDDDQQTHPQSVDAKTLKPGLVTRYRRPDVKTRSKPRGRNPK